jgi:hypothetical protein
MAEPMPEWMRDLVNNVGDRAVRDLVEDFRSYNPHPAQGPSAKVSVQGAPTVKTGDVGPQHRAYQGGEDDNADRSGWRDAPGIKPPPGVDIIDEMCAAEDRSWRLQRAKELASAQHARALVEAEKMGLTYAEWSRLSEKDIADRKARQAKKAEDKK